MIVAEFGGGCKASLASTWKGGIFDSEAGAIWDKLPEECVDGGKGLSFKE